MPPGTDHQPQAMNRTPPLQRVALAVALVAGCIVGAMIAFVLPAIAGGA